MSWKDTIAKKPTWKDSIMRSKPITPDEMKADVLKLVLPEIKEKTSWKNTLSITPKNGVDGKRGSKIFTGTNPDKVSAIDGDVFINTETGDLFQWED